jgi:hypothetical protein
MRGSGRLAVLIEPENPLKGLLWIMANGRMYVSLALPIEAAAAA